MLKVEIDKQSGFCFGVVNAITRAEESLTAKGKVFSLGDIVHNRVEVQRLAELGLESVGHDALAGLAGRTLLIRAHGEPPETYRTAEELGIEVIDATCPVVARLQKIVSAAHERMKKEGGQVVILGKRGHAEVVGLAGQADGNVIVIEGEQDLEQIDFARPVYLLSQTTQSLDLFESISEAIKGRAADPDKVTIHDTICRQVSGRGPHLKEFTARFDVVIFVSGRKSSNGRVLFEVCRSVNPRTYLVEDEKDLRAEWFEGASTVGICGATSTPGWLMERVAQEIKNRY